MDRQLRARLERRFEGEADRARPPAPRPDRAADRPGDVTEVLAALHDEPDLDFAVLADLAGVDTGDHMQVVYHLWSAKTPDWLRVIADGLPRDNPRIATLTGLWPGAEWMERETYDMFGIVFEGNRDLRRIYMPPDYTSFPLRKDFYLRRRRGPEARRRRPAHGADPRRRPRRRTAWSAAP